jgi:hypothetical protein
MGTNTAWKALDRKIHCYFTQPKKGSKDNERDKTNRGTELVRWMIDFHNLPQDLFLFHYCYDQVEELPSKKEERLILNSRQGYSHDVDDVVICFGMVSMEHILGISSFAENRNKCHQEHIWVTWSPNYMLQTPSSCVDAARIIVAAARSLGYQDSTNISLKRFNFDTFIE